MEIQLSTPGDRRLSAAITIVFHIAVLLALWLFFRFQYPDPPLGSSSIAVSMAGDTFSAGGNSQTTSQPRTSPQPQPTTPNQASEQVTTSDTESDVVVQDNQNPDPVTETTSTPVDSEPVEQASEPEPQISDGLADALSGLGSSGSNDGSGQNTGTGTEGTSDGKIDGTGVISGGDGFGFSLAGRGLTGQPSVTGNPAEEGTIVFDIWVDKDGNLEKFKPNYLLSTSTAAGNIKIAERALATVKFSANPNAPHIQKGQFTFVFKLN